MTASRFPGRCSLAALRCSFDRDGRLFGGFSVSDRKYLFTSESVSMGHPDKLADQISDGVLDALLAQDPKSRVACETLVTTDYCMLAGEITTTAKVDYEKVAREVIAAVGYTHDDIGFNAKTCKVEARTSRWASIKMAPATRA